MGKEDKEPLGGGSRGWPELGVVGARKEEERYSFEKKGKSSREGACSVFSNKNWGRIPSIPALSVRPSRRGWEILQFLGTLVQVCKKKKRSSPALCWCCLVGKAGARRGRGKGAGGPPCKDDQRWRGGASKAENGTGSKRLGNCARTLDAVQDARRIFRACTHVP